MFKKKAHMMNYSVGLRGFPFGASDKPVGCIAVI